METAEPAGDAAGFCSVVPSTPPLWYIGSYSALLPGTCKCYQTQARAEIQDNSARYRITLLPPEPESNALSSLMSGHFELGVFKVIIR